VEEPISSSEPVYLAPHPSFNLQSYLLHGDIDSFALLGREFNGLGLRKSNPLDSRPLPAKTPQRHTTTTVSVDTTTKSQPSQKARIKDDKLAPPTLRPNLGKSQREYIKRRAEEIRSSASFVPNDAYPKSAWKLVAWWNTCFGTAGFPEPTTVQAEIARRHPREFDFLEYSIPTTLLNNEGNRRGNTGSAHRTNSESQAPSRAAATKTLAERITPSKAQQTLAERITFPDDQQTSNLASRITYPAGHPSSLESRITFPKRPDDRHRIRKRGTKDAAPRRN
jgi:hypothetical protein